MVTSGEALDDCNLIVDDWMQEMIIKLLELTHSMRIYRNLVVHDVATGLHAVRQKEALWTEIGQLELGGEGLAESDRWMLEVNWSEFEESTFNGRSVGVLATGN